MNFWLQTLGLSVLAYLIAVKIFKRVAKAFFPQILKFLMTRMHSRIRSIKPKLFEEAFDKVDTSNKSGKLEILELGIGTGENFRCFPHNSNITILDKTDIFLPVLQESIDQHRKDLTISKLVVNSAEKMSSIESNTMDAVVHTFVLCSIPDTTATLKEIYRVLKPGGVFIFIDHAAEDENLSRQIVQRLVEPFLSDCNFKNIKGILKNGPFENLVIKDYSGLDGFFNTFNPVVYGYGIKSK